MSLVFQYFNYHFSHLKVSQNLASLVIKAKTNVESLKTMKFYSSAD